MKGRLVTRMERHLWLRLLYVVIALTLVASTLTACGGGGKEDKATSAPTATLTSTPAVKELEVPINLKDARNVGSLHMEIVYDPAVLSVIDVEAGELGSNAMIEFSLSTQGRVKVGIVDASGINGDGAVVTVSFKAIDKNKTSQLALENLECYSAKTLYDFVVKSSPGNLSAVDGSYTAAEVTFVY